MCAPLKLRALNQCGSLILNAAANAQVGSATVTVEATALAAVIHKPDGRPNAVVLLHCLTRNQSCLTPLIYDLCVPDFYRDCGLAPDRRTGSCSRNLGI